MFRKLVSNLSFSPALVGQLGFYARRLRKEEVTRRMGLIFTVLALILQSFAVFRPPEAAFAASPSNIIYGGVQTVDDLLRVYDNPTHDFKDLLTYFGITRAELASMNRSVQYVCSTDKSIVSFGRQHHYSAGEGEIRHDVPRTKSVGSASVFYSVPLHRFDNVNGHTNCYDSYVGNSKKVGWFSIMRKCGNLQIKKNITPRPQGAFVAATCDVIQGYAYDERQPSLPVSVILYVGGPPGKGEKYGPIAANQTTPQSPVGSGHGFTLQVPAKYQTKTTPTEVWGVLLPLAGWNESTVQLQNKATIPGNCIKPAPIATCNSLQLKTITRTTYQLTAASDVANGAKIEGYTFTVTDSTGKVVYQKVYPSSAVTLTSDVFTLAATGKYSASVTVKTSVGDKTNAQNCVAPITIPPEDKCLLNPNIPNGPECKPCPYDSSVWIKDDKNCIPKITQYKEARNISNNSDANGTTAAPTDRIEYTLYTKNESQSAVTKDIQEELTDVLEYTHLLDNGGGTLQDAKDVNNSAARKLLRWENVTILPGQTVVKKLVVQVNETIPATPQSAGDPASFNCVISNSYGNTINISMQCPVVKGVETTIKELPKTGPGENMIFAGTTLTVVTYFYARSRQMGKEIKLIRREFNHGTL